jgi:hypothetical protein
MVSGSANAADKIQGTVSGAVGYTDNAFSSPDYPIPEVPPREGDVISVITPGIEYVIYSPAALHRAGYSLTANLFLLHTSAIGFGNRLEWESVFFVSPQVNLLLGASATQDHHHTANTVSNVSATAARAFFPGTARFIMARAEESLAVGFGPFWESRQTSTLALQTPLFGEGSQSFEWANSVGVDKLWRDDALGPLLRFDYAYITDSFDPETLLPAGGQAQIITGAALVWRHDWGRYFTHRLEAGVVQVDRLTRGGRYRSPAGGASIAYANDDALADVSYRHTVTTDLYLGQTLLVDDISLHAAIPLDKDATVWLGASAGYQDGRMLDLDGELATPVDLILGDIGLAWQVEDEIRLALRYQHVEQMAPGGDDYARSLTEPQLLPLPVSYVRNTIMLSATFELPRETDMPRRYRSPRRVDREDEVRDQLEEPVDNPGAGATRL